MVKFLVLSVIPTAAIFACESIHYSQFKDLLKFHLKILDTNLRWNCHIYLTWCFITMCWQLSTKTEQNCLLIPWMPWKESAMRSWKWRFLVLSSGRRAGIFINNYDISITSISPILIWKTERLAGRKGKTIRLDLHDGLSREHKR